MAITRCDEALTRHLNAALPYASFEVVAADDALVERVRLGQCQGVLLGPGASHAADLALTKRIKASPAGRVTPLVLLTRASLPRALREGSRAGADEVLPTGVAPELLALRVHMLLRLCSAHHDAARAARAARLDELVNAHIEALCLEHGLSAREREVLRLLVLGRTPHDIGVALGITARTAKFHQGNLLAKLGAESKFDLVRLLF